MFSKTTTSGKIRFLEKFYDERRKQWRQAEVTMNTDSRQAQQEATRQLDKKIAKMLAEPTDEEKIELERETITVREVYDKWRIIRADELKSTTYQSQGQILEFLFRNIWERPISKIDIEDIENIIFVANRSIKTKRAYKALLQGFFDYAVNHKKMNENPVKSIHLPKRQITTEDVKRARDKFLTYEEMQQVIAFAESGKMNCSNNSKFYAENTQRFSKAYEFLFWTGLRIGELQALRFEDIEENIAHITHSIDRRNYRENERVLVEPKTVHSYRDVLLNKQASKIIEYFSQSGKDKDFIFTDMNGEVMVYKTLQQHFKKLCSRALPESQKIFSLHMLRHSAISFMAELGLPERVIMSQVGHANATMSMHYTHTTDRMKKELSEKLSLVGFA